MDRGKEEVAVAQVAGEVVLEILPHLLILIVGEQIFAGMICMVPQTTLDNVLSYALRETACLVVPSAAGRVVAVLNALDDGSVGQGADRDAGAGG